MECVLIMNDFATAGVSVIGRYVLVLGAKGAGPCITLYNWDIVYHISGALSFVHFKF
jgi:hypothetical protein